MTRTCLDCVHLDIETKPTPGHPCHNCDGKLMALRVNGSGWTERACDNCKHAMSDGRCAVRISEAERVFYGLPLKSFAKSYNDPCVDYSAWEKKPCLKS